MTPNLVHFPSAALDAELHLTEGWVRQTFQSLTDALETASHEDTQRIVAMSRRCEDVILTFTTAAMSRLNTVEAQR